jgi:hypothetical protein
MERLWERLRLRPERTQTYIRPLKPDKMKHSIIQTWNKGSWQIETWNPINVTLYQTGHWHDDVVRRKLTRSTRSDNKRCRACQVYVIRSHTSTAARTDRLTTCNRRTDRQNSHNDRHTSHTDRHNRISDRRRRARNPVVSWVCHCDRQGWCWLSEGCCSSQWPDSWAFHNDNTSVREVKQVRKVWQWRHNISKLMARYLTLCMRS